MQKFLLDAGESEVIPLRYLILLRDLSAKSN